MGPLALRAGCMARDTETPCLTCGRSQTRPARPPPQPLPGIIVSDNPSRGSRRSAEKRAHDLSLPRRRVEELSTPAEIRLRFASFKHGDNNMKIYLAGPLFSAAERTFNNELTRWLRNKGHEVWLPQEFEQRTMTAKQIFNKDSRRHRLGRGRRRQYGWPGSRLGDVLGVRLRLSQKAGHSVSNGLSRWLQTARPSASARGAKRPALQSDAD